MWLWSTPHRQRCFTNACMGREAVSGLAQSSAVRHVALAAVAAHGVLAKVIIDATLPREKHQRYVKVVYPPVDLERYLRPGD